MGTDIHRSRTPALPQTAPSGEDAFQATLSGGEILIRFPYRWELVEQVRKLPSRRWDPELVAWRVPDTPADRDAVRKVLGVEPVPAKDDAAAGDHADAIQSAQAQERGETPCQSPEEHASARLSLPARPLERFEDEMRLRGYALPTRRAYLGHARRLLAEWDASLELAEAIRSHILRKLDGGKMSRSYHNQLISALRLFCSEVLHHQLDRLPLDRPRRETRLPSVLSPEEFRRFLGAIRNPKHLALFAVTYSAGLRVSEVVRLRPEDLDRDRGTIQVRGGKGRKDRRTLLSASALALVDAYLRDRPPGRWLFPGGRPGRHLNTRTVQRVAEMARQRAGITKHVTPHVLRHSFATHLMENGTDVRVIQELLGHASVRTTEIYTHVSRRHIERIRSPFDVPPADDP